MLKPKTVRLRYYRSVYGIPARIVKKLGGIEYLDSLDEDARSVIINQQKGYAKEREEVEHPAGPKRFDHKVRYRIRSLRLAKSIAYLTERISGERTAITEINHRHYRVVRYSGEKKSFV